jgi:hypothetical protein
MIELHIIRLFREYNWFYRLLSQSIHVFLFHAYPTISSECTLQNKGDSGQIYLTPRHMTAQYDSLPETRTCTVCGIIRWNPPYERIAGGVGIPAM